jgi:exosortase E/protease (VPEID-CTERM system)
MRIAAWLLLCFVELLTVSVVYDFQDIVGVGNPVFYVRSAALWALCSVAVFVLISWPQRYALGAAWRSFQEQHDRRAPLVLNIAFFCTILAAAPLLSSMSTADPAAARIWLTLFAGLIIALAISLLRLDVPFRALLDIGARHRVKLAVALCAGAMVEFVSYLAQDSWRVLAGATLQLSSAILRLYERDVGIDVSENSLSVGRFKVIIAESCSGYEGIGLVILFLTIFLWVFRAGLRFPNALLLLPIGVACIWVLNAVRIAVLVSIGAHLSPRIAQQGFHSQAGWIAFLAVAASIMVLAHRSAFFARTSAARPRTRADRRASAFLMPFVALMLASVLIAAAAPHDRALYPVKIVAVLLVVWAYRDVYQEIHWGSYGEPALAGLIVGAAWIATADPDPDAGAALGAWLGQQGVAWLVVWLGLRVIGSVFIVPVVEELGFRGFLYRWIVARNFQEVSFAHFSAVALVASSLAFGLLHGRWVAASVSGAVFALVMWRTNSLSGPIVAHAVANALICAWAIGAGQWSLL